MADPRDAFDYEPHDDDGRDWSAELVDSPREDVARLNRMRFAGRAPGDWQCSRCKAVVPASASACFDCGASR